MNKSFNREIVSSPLRSWFEQNQAAISITSIVIVPVLVFTLFAGDRSHAKAFGGLLLGLTLLPNVVWGAITLCLPRRLAVTCYACGWKETFPR